VGISEESWAISVVSAASYLKLKSLALTFVSSGSLLGNNLVKFCSSFTGALIFFCLSSIAFDALSLLAVAFRL